MMINFINLKYFWVMKNIFIFLKIMIRNIIVLAILSIVLWSCGTSRSVSNRSVGRVLESNNTKLSTPKNASKLISNAENYLGTPYKLGGVTKSGMDCSGLVSKVFEHNNIRLPRRSEDQSKEGKPIAVKDIKTGDLVFFATGGGSRVSHVGIVSEIGREGEIRFIHASTSKGVIISSLNETYWNRAFLFARRIL